MDIGRPTFRDAVSRYLRARVSALRVRASALAESTPPLRPDHGGATGTTGTENPAREDEDSGSRRARHEALLAIAEYLALPRDANLHIEVDVDGEQVTFRIRDADGRVLHTLAETEANGLVDVLGTFHGSLVDRRL